MGNTWDFRGYATKNDLKCADGRTIRKNAFIECDGTVVPLVWQHSHGKPGDVLGHAILENRDDGVVAYGYFNDTDNAKTTKELVRHGDIRALSIYANQLIQKGSDVIHGVIREVSLCLAGANPGAMIEDLSFEHFDDEDTEFEAQIWNGENIELWHSEDKAKSDEDGSKEEDKKEEPKVSDNSKSVQDVIDTMNEEQQNVLYYAVNEAFKKGASSAKPAAEEKEEDEEDTKMMKHSFENENTVNNDELVHDAFNAVISDGKRFGSLRESYNFHTEEGAIAHAIDTTGMDLPTMTNQEFKTQVGYGINSPEMLFPDAHNLDTTPRFIQRDTSWADVVWNGVHRVPWSRIKSTFANITEDEARAKGYIKGNEKKDEFFSVMKRVTVPQTVYKKQKLDRDDIVDITDFDVVRWIRSEMRVMWDEETARAMLIGDGRTSTDPDAISPEHIRPIASDLPLFSIQTEVVKGADEYATAKNFMKAAIRARKDYKGSGNPTLFTTEDVLTSMLLIEDGIGHYIYKSEAELATALRVAKIVTVPVMEGFKLENGNDLMGIIVNLKDYAVGTDKGGEVNLFDDFDIDYNQYKYLIEARCSGALIVPYSAIVLSVDNT